MPFIIPDKLTKISNKDRFSKYKHIAESKWFLLQKRRAPFRNERTPTYRIITQQAPFYEIAHGADLKDIKENEWDYLINYLPKVIPAQLPSKMLQMWVIAHFTQLALETGAWREEGEAQDQKGRWASSDDEDEGQSELKHRQNSSSAQGNQSSVINPSLSPLQSRVVASTILSPISLTASGGMAADKRGGGEDDEGKASGEGKELTMQKKDMYYNIGAKQSLASRALGHRREEGDDSLSKPVMHRVLSGALRPSHILPLRGVKAWLANAVCTLVAVMVARELDHLPLSLLLLAVNVLSWMLFCSGGPLVLSLEYYPATTASSGSNNNSSQPRPSGRGRGMEWKRKVRREKRSSPSNQTESDDDLSEGDEMSPRARARIVRDKTGTDSSNNDRHNANDDESDSVLHSKSSYASSSSSSSSSASSSSSSSSASASAPEVALSIPMPPGAKIPMGSTVSRVSRMYCQCGVIGEAEFQHNYSGDSGDEVASDPAAAKGSTDNTSNSAAAASSTSPSTSSSSSSNASSILNLNSSSNSNLNINPSSNHRPASTPRGPNGPLSSSSQNSAFSKCTHMPPNTWGSLPASNFSVRVGPNYKRTKAKSASKEALFRAMGVDFFQGESKIDHVMEKIILPDVSSLPVSEESDEPEVADSGVGAVPQWLVVNFQIPNYAPEIPFIGTPKKDGEGVSVVMYFCLTKATKAKLQKGGDLEPALNLLKRFFANDQSEDLRRRFKAIPRIPNPEDTNFGPATRTLMTSYNAKPFMTGPRCHTWYEGPNYAEVDINVHMFCYLARKGLHASLTEIPEMVVDVAFVVEGVGDEEQPEQVCGSLRISRLTADSAPTLQQVYERSLRGESSSLPKHPQSVRERQSSDESD